MPTRNRAALIPIGIESIIQQSYEDWELIIIDDGSTDTTKTVVFSFSDHRIRYIYQQHKERSSARNKGIELAQGRYICFIDDDDYWLPEHLQTFANAIPNQAPNPPILRVGYFREKRGIREKTHLYKSQEQLPALYAALNFCGIWSLAIPRPYLNEHQFPVNFRHWQDTHLLIRLLALYPFQQLDAFTYVYRIHDIMGSLLVYQEVDAEARIESNVAAMHHLFENYAAIVDPVLPSYLHHFLVCQKYLEHAHGALATGNFSLAKTLVRASLRFNTGGWFYRSYFKFLIKWPLKWLTGYPSLK